MKIDSIEAIWNNLELIVQMHNGYKEIKRGNFPIYNCSPILVKDGSIKNTFIEVGYLYLGSRIPDDSQGFIHFHCTDRINYDNDHKIYSDKLPEQILNKLTGKHNTYIAQIFNDEVKEYLHKDTNIEWHLSKGQALFTTLKEAEEYIKRCEDKEIDVKKFTLKLEKVIDNPTKEDYEK